MTDDDMTDDHRGAERPAAEPETYGEFWPFYLGEHSRPGTRRLHFIGTTGAIIALILLVITGAWWWILIALLSGYAFAWVSHWAIEHNQPATFRFPLWSLFSDFRMYFTWLTGGLDRELRRHGIEG